MRQTLDFAAKLRMPSTTTARDRAKRVASMVAMLGLEGESHTWLVERGGEHTTRVCLSFEMDESTITECGDSVSVSGLASQTSQNLGSGTNRRP